MTTAFNEDWQEPGDEMYIRPSQRWFRREEAQFVRRIFEFKDDHGYAPCPVCDDRLWRCCPGLVWSQVMAETAPEIRDEELVVECS